MGTAWFSGEVEVDGNTWQVSVRLVQQVSSNT
jgi:hypothetical protein